MNNQSDLDSIPLHGMFRPIEHCWRISALHHWNNKIPKQYSSSRITGQQKQHYLKDIHTNKPGMQESSAPCSESKRRNLNQSGTSLGSRNRASLTDEEVIPRSAFRLGQVKSSSCRHPCVSTKRAKWVSVRRLLGLNTNSCRIQIYYRKFSLNIMRLFNHFCISLERSTVYPASIAVNHSWGNINISKVVIIST